MTLYQRLALTIVASFTLVLSLFYWWTQQLQQASYDEAEQRLHIELADHLAGDNPLLAEGVYDYKALENLFHTLMILGPGFEFYFVDPEGKLLTYSAEPGKVVREHVDLAPIKTLLASSESLPVYGDDPRSEQGRKVFSVAAVNNQDQLQGYLYVIIGGEIADNVLAHINDNNQLWGTAWIMLAALMLLVMVLLGLFKGFTSPLRQLTDDMRLICQSGFDTAKVPWLAQRATGYGQDAQPAVFAVNDNEVTQLGHSFALMLAQIQSQIEQLNHNDTQRRELLADLSHDLRTPLASLQGYVETILIKGDELSSDERQKYTQVIFKNTQALRQLIDQIFELAYLDGGQVSVNLEQFPIADLMLDITDKFKLKAEDAGVELIIHPPRDINEQDLTVYADIAKLERVMSNLIDNALRHTPKGGKIEILLVKVGERVRVDIKDTGSGISAQDITYIFNARYRASNAVNSKTKHAGLGLAITKKLVELFNGDISVDSQLGKGTCFSLVLSSAP